MERRFSTVFSPFKIACPKGFRKSTKPLVTREWPFPQGMDNGFVPDRPADVGTPFPRRYPMMSFPSHNRLSYHIACQRRCRSVLAATVTAIGLVAVCTSCLSAADAPCLSPVAYDAATDYPVGSVVLGADGNAYRAVSKVKAKDPTTANESSWQLAHVSTDLVIDVPGRFKTIQQAWKFLDGATVAAAATVKVQVAPGRYEFKEELALDHPHGDRIVIAGSGPKPDRCTLVFAGTHGIVVRNGNRLTIRNLVVDEAAASPPKEKSGLLVETGAAVVIDNCVISGFWFGCFVANGSRLHASDCRLETTTGWAGAEVRNNSSGIFVKCKSEQKLPTGSAFKAGAGFIVCCNSSLLCDDCRATGWGQGFSASSCGDATLTNCVADENRNMGVSAWRGSSFVINQGSFSHSEIGVHVDGSTAVINGATIADNKHGLHVFGTGYASLFENRSTFRGNGIAIDSKFGGKVYGMPPEFIGNNDDMKAWTPGRDVKPEEQILWSR
jgi:hypothetical protein